MSMCAQLESYRGQKELYTELSIVSAKVGNQFFLMQEFPCFWRTLRFGVKKQLAQRRDACSVSTDFVLLIFFLEEKPAQTKHMSLSIIIIYIYSIYIYIFFLSLSLSNVFFSRRRRLEFALVRVPTGL